MRRTDPDKTVQEVGLRIAELREERGWTQEELASRARVTVKRVQQVEGGRANLTIFSLVRLANVLGVGPGDLFVKPTRKRRRPGRPPRST